MDERGQGLSAPTHQHTPSPTINLPSNYISGFCSTGYHVRCVGDFRTALCACDCHTAPPPAPIVIATVRCFFGCPAVVACEDPQQAHAAMEGHYWDTHRPDIAAALWAAS